MALMITKTVCSGNPRAASLTAGRMSDSKKSILSIVSRYVGLTWKLQRLVDTTQPDTFEEK